MRRKQYFMNLMACASSVCLFASAGLAQDARTSNVPGSEHMLPRAKVAPGEGGVAGLTPGLYGLSSTSPGVLYTINPATGLATVDTALNGDASFTGISFRGAGELYGTDLINYPGGTGTWEMGRIDPVSGVITFENDQAGCADWHGLATNEATGEMYSICNVDTGLNIYDPATGIITPGGITGIDGRGMAYDDGTGTLYALSGGTNELYTVNTGTGVPTLVGALGVNINFRAGLAYDEDTDTLYMNIVPVTGGVSQLYTVNTATGAATFVGSNAANAIDGLAWLGGGGGGECAADLDGDGVVGPGDLAIVLGNWGPCP